MNLENSKSRFTHDAVWKSILAQRITTENFNYSNFNWNRN